MNAYRRRKLEGVRDVASRRIVASGVAVGCSQEVAWVSSGEKSPYHQQPDRILTSRYYPTMLHEAGPWTGTGRRLNRLSERALVESLIREGRNMRKPREPLDDLGV